MKTIQYCCTLLFTIACFVTKAQITSKKEPYKFLNADTTLKELDPVKAAQAKTLVLDFTRILSKGDNVDSVINLCSVPFSCNRKEIIDTKGDLKTVFQKIVEDKGKNRYYEVDTVFIRAIRREVLDNIIPLNIYYVVIRMKVMKNGTIRKSSPVLFAVQVTDDPKIIGIAD
ncbi:hypothetical protein [Ferruginibacter sp.]